MRMRVLLTNNTLAGRAGSEMYVLDVARRLKTLGHEPMAFSTQLGEVAEALRAAAVPVVSDLNDLPTRPDIIHGQHHVETMLALLALPGVPAVFFCHGALPWEELPPVFPRIRRYVAVDEACRERVVQETGQRQEAIPLVLNFVDLQRFEPRPLLPDRPRRALVFSNYMSDANHLNIVREACARSGIELDARGKGVYHTVAEPERLLPKYDLVFAKARAALEAMAVGAAVVVCDTRGCGPLVTAENFDSLRPWNFGFRTMQQALTVENLQAQINRYDAADAMVVRDKVRAQAGLQSAVDKIVQIYEQVIAEQREQAGTNLEEELRAAGNYLSLLVPVIKRIPRGKRFFRALPSGLRSLAELLARTAVKLVRRLRKR